VGSLLKVYVHGKERGESEREKAACAEQIEKGL
jgi:hypothetical protein